MKSFLFLFAALTLSACANAPFPEILEETKTINSDSKNVAYEDESTEINEENHEKMEAVKTKPVFKGAVDNNNSDEKLITVTEASFIDDETQISTNGEPSVVYLADTFYFANGSHTPQEVGTRIRKIASAAKKHNAKIKVLGYASSRTRNTDPASHKMANFQVSLDRANSVAKALKKAGVKQKNIIVEALSDSTPAYQEVMPEGERLNRRAEVYIVY